VTFVPRLNVFECHHATQPHYVLIPFDELPSDRCEVCNAPLGHISMQKLNHLTIQPSRPVASMTAKNPNV